MAYFQLGDQQFQLKAGPQRVGPAETGADVVLPSGAATATAIVVVNTDQTVVISRASADSIVMVNKVQLGAEPSPLFHGDHVELGGHDLRFGDTKQGGSTQFVSAAEIAEVLKVRQSTPAKPTTATGGRLVSQLDGREYSVPDKGLTIGRDPSVEIVVPTTEVSRRHVQIAPAGHGYMLTDLSTNGVWVNGTRVAREQLLGRGDLIRVANEEFRFYADTAKSPRLPSPTPVPATAAVVEAPAPVPVAAQAAQPAPAAPAPPPAPVAAPQPAPAPAPAPVAPVTTPAPPSTPRAPWATLEVMNEGPDKGRRVEVFSALTNIGRGPHNDLVISSESVSDSHAKLQKRETGWYIVDIESTNGTYVGGHRVIGAQALLGAPDLRFGDVKVAFHPAADARDSNKSTRAITGVSLDDLKRAAARRVPEEQTPTPIPPEVAEAPAPQPIATRGTAPPWFWGLLVLVGAAVIGFLYLRGA